MIATDLYPSYTKIRATHVLRLNAGSALTRVECPVSGRYTGSLSKPVLVDGSRQVTHFIATDEDRQYRVLGTDLTCTDFILPANGSDWQRDSVQVTHRLSRVGKVLRRSPLTDTAGFVISKRPYLSQVERADGTVSLAITYNVFIPATSKVVIALDRDVHFASLADAPPRPPVLLLPLPPERKLLTARVGESPAPAPVEAAHAAAPLDLSELEAALVARLTDPTAGVAVNAAQSRVQVNSNNVGRSVFFLHELGVTISSHDTGPQLIRCPGLPFNQLVTLIQARQAELRAIEAGHLRHDLVDAIKHLGIQQPVHLVTRFGRVDVYVGDHALLTLRHNRTCTTLTPHYEVNAGINLRSRPEWTQRYFVSDANHIEAAIDAFNASLVKSAAPVPATVTA